MGETNKVVVRYLDNRTLKGTTEDFFQNRPSFHVYVAGEATSQLVQCAELKAVFFVKDLAGDSDRQDTVGFTREANETSAGKKIAALFKDGEVLCGHTLSYTPDRPGFFVMPDDSGTNNLRVYVLRHATAKVGVGPKADDVVREAKRDAA